MVILEMTGGNFSLLQKKQTPGKPTIETGTFRKAGCQFFIKEELLLKGSGHVSFLFLPVPLSVQTETPSPGGSLALAYRWHVLQVTLLLLCPQKKKVIRNNSFPKNWPEKEKRSCWRKILRSNKKYHYIGRTGRHLSERQLPLCVNGRKKKSFIYTWS